MKKLVNLFLCSVMLISNIVMPVKANDTQSIKNTKEIDNDYVQPVDFSSFNKEIKNDDYYEMLKTGLLNANKYALTTWFNEKKNLDEDTGKYWDLKKASGNSGTNEYIYRFPSAQAFAISIALRTGAYDEDYTGVSAEEAKKIAIKLATSVAYGHKENGGNYASWGDDWQAAHWAFYSGYAAWLLWDDLTDEEQSMVQKMIVYEANRFNNTNAVYWKTPNGTELYKGDSKIEEDAWNSELMNFALQMMPKHENRDIWEYRSIEYQLAAFSTPEMTKSNEMIHGREAKDWLYGYNVNDDGTVINHGIVHPTYNAASTGVNMSIVNTLVHKKMPVAAKYNLDKLYGGLSEYNFKVEDGYREPGGTIYIPNSPEIYYPQGNDWGTGIYDVYMNIDTSAYVYGFGKEADKWAKLHCQRVLDQQNRHEDKHAYKDNNENSYLGKEEAISTRFGCAFMTYWLNVQEPVEFEDTSVEYPHEKLPPVSENEIRIPVSDTTYVRGGSNSDTNYYTTDVLEVKNDGGPDSAYTREAYMKFDFDTTQGIPQKAIINLPIVKLGNLVEKNQIENVVELIADNNWHADTLTFNNKPVPTGIVLGRWIPNEEGLQIDVTKYVQQAALQDKKLSLRIYSTVNKGGDTFAFYGSKRQANPNYIPSLVLSYTDELTSVIKGNEEIKRNEEFELSYMLGNLKNDKKYRAIVEYGKSDFSLEDTKGFEGVQIRKSAEILPGKHYVDFTLNDNSSEIKDILKLNLTAKSSGVKTVKIELFDSNGTNLNTAIKTITVSTSELSGSFIGEEQKIISKEAVADTTLRYGDENPSVAESNGKKVELDCKTYPDANARQSLVKFDFSEFGNIEDAESINVKLSVLRTPNIPTNGDSIYRFQAVESNWEEYKVTWSTKPDSVKNVTQDPKSMPAADENTLLESKLRVSTVDIDVTEYVKKHAAKGDTEMSIFVYALESTNSSVVFASREYSDVNVRPQITVKYPVKEVKIINESYAEVNYGSLIESSFKISGITDLNNPEMEISYDVEALKFEKLIANEAKYMVEIIENNPGKLRVKVGKGKSRASLDEELFKIQWSPKKEGETTITTTTSSNQLGVITSVQTIKIKDRDYVELNKKLDQLKQMVSESEKLRNQFSTYNFMNMDSLLQKCNEIIATDIKLLSDDEVDYYVKKLDLEKKDLENCIARRGLLKERVAESNQKQENNYTTETWEVFKNALSKAQLIINDVNATFEELNDALITLDNAISQLVEKNPSNPIKPVEPAEPITPIEPEIPSDNELVKDESKKDEVSTGDATNFVPYVGILLFASLSLLCVLKKYKKQEE